MPDNKDGSAHLDGLAQDAPDAPREHSEPSATPSAVAFYEALFADPEGRALVRAILEVATVHCATEQPDDPLVKALDALATWNYRWLRDAPFLPD